MKFISLIILCLNFCFLLSSCMGNSDEGKYTGVRADEEVVASIRKEIADKENSLLANENDVFWTESGKLWHSTHECTYLANSKTILHGTIEEARLDGKEKACERCSKSNYDSVYASLENSEYKLGDVFFTKDGNVWHTNINCNVIIGAQKIYFADKETAKYLGKVCVCQECE